MNCPQAPQNLTGLTGQVPIHRVRIVLPYHLRNLAKVGDEVTLALQPPITQSALLDSLEIAYPMLRGTIRDHATKSRRPFLRFFACGEDISHEPADTPLPSAVAEGKEPFFVMGAISGG